MENLILTMAVFTGVAAIALLIQMAFLFGIFRAVKTFQERAASFMDRWEPLAETSRQKMEVVSKQTTEILGRVREIADSTKNQVDKADTVMTDISRGTKVQMERLDETVEITLRRVNETTLALQRTVLLPVRHVRGLVAGLAAVIDNLVGSRRRATVDRATLDEEMFI